MEQGSDDDVSVSSLSATIQGRLIAKTPQYSQRRCIYRVLSLLRETNEQAFTPLIVSIGPLHRNNVKLRLMESHKLKYLRSFLGEPRANVELLKSCLKIIKSQELKIRDGYADPFDLTSDKFTEMVLIDSVFIILFFWILKCSQPQGDDYVFNRPFLRNSVLRDLQLEENQLPLFIIDQLYSAKFPTGESSSINPTPPFMGMVCDGLGIKPRVYNAYPQHLLHLVALDGQPPVPTNTRIDRNVQNGGSITTVELVSPPPPATQLHAAGVKFQAIKNSPSLLDIQFDKEILKIPELEVSDLTEFWSRNLIAFEQCHYDPYDQTSRYFTDYYFFLNWLINTPEDVNLLAEAGIIKNLMGCPQQVSDLINSLDTGAITSSNRYNYENISLQLQSHCKKRWNKHRATLRHKYFNHPWATISVVYAIILLLLTIAQVVSGFWALFK